MKALLLASVLLVSLSAVAADAKLHNTSQVTSTQGELVAPEQSQWASEVPPSQSFERRAPRNPDPGFVISPDRSGHGGCAYIHAFVFELNDGEAPKLVGETYCTPLSRAYPHNAVRPHGAPALGPYRVNYQH
jgi:hypothetical protein